MLDNMILADLLCDRGSVLKDMAAVAETLDCDSKEYKVVLDYMVFMLGATKDAYNDALAESKRNVTEFKPPRTVQ